MPAALRIGGLPLGKHRLKHLGHADIPRCCQGEKLSLELGPNLEVQLHIAPRAPLAAAIAELTFAVLLVLVPAVGREATQLGRARHGNLVPESEPCRLRVALRLGRAHRAATFLLGATLVVRASLFSMASHSAAISAFAVLSFSGPAWPGIIALASTCRSVIS